MYFHELAICFVVRYVDKSLSFSAAPKPVTWEVSLFMATLVVAGCSWRVAIWRTLGFFGKN